MLGLAYLHLNNYTQSLGINGSNRGERDDALLRRQAQADGQPDARDEAPEALFVQVTRPGRRITGFRSCETLR